MQMSVTGDLWCDL